MRGCLEQMMTRKLDPLWMQASLTLTECAAWERGRRGGCCFIAAQYKSIGGLVGCVKVVCCELSASRLVARIAVGVCGEYVIDDDDGGVRQDLNCTLADRRLCGERTILRP